MTNNDGKLIFDVTFEPKDLDKSIDKLKKVFDKDAKKMQKNLSKTTTDNVEKGINEGFDKAGKKIEKTGKSFFGNLATSIIGWFSIGSIFKSVLNIGSEFEKGLAKVSTLVDTNIVDMKKWGKELKEISNETGLSIDGVTEATYQALSASVKQENVNQLLLKSNKLAVGGYSDITTAIDVTTTILNAYGFAIEETDRIHKILIQTQNKGKTTVGELGAYISQVIPIATQFSVSMETVGASLSTLTATGDTTSAATTKLKALISELGKTGTKSNKVLKDLYQNTEHSGKSFDELMKSGVKLNDILRDLEKLAKKSNINLVDFFGSTEAAGAAATIAANGYDIFNDSLEAMSTELDVVSEAFDKNNTSSKKFNDLLNKFKNVGIDAFIAIEPMLTKILNALIKLMDGFSNLNPTLQGTILVIGGLLIILPTLISTFGLISTAITIFTGGTTLATLATTAFTTVLGILFSPITLIIGGITAIVTALLLMITNLKVADSWWGNLGRTIANGVISVLNWLIEKLNSVINLLNKIPGINIGNIGTVNNVKAEEGPSKKISKKNNNMENAIKSSGFIPKLAKGGTVAGGGLFIAGEQGRELLSTEKGKTTVIPLNNRNNNLGSNVNLNINISNPSFNNKNDINTLTNLIMNKVSKQLRY